jgi:ribosomal-protein-alanine N-acetyltransferase
MNLQQPARDWIVRGYEPADAAAIEEIARKSGEAAQWPRESFEKLDAAGQQAWVVEAGGKVCGFLATRRVADEAEILNLAIDPVRRRGGLASALLDAAFVEWRRQGVKRIFLEVRESNQAAIHLYKRNGFAILGRRPGYYRDPGEAAICMEKKVTG